MSYQVSKVQLRRFSHPDPGFRDVNGMLFVLTTETSDDPRDPHVNRMSELFGSCRCQEVMREVKEWATNGVPPNPDVIRLRLNPDVKFRTQYSKVVGYWTRKQ